MKQFHYRITTVSSRENRGGRQIVVYAETEEEAKELLKKIPEYLGITKFYGTTPLDPFGKVNVRYGSKWDYDPEFNKRRTKQ